MTENLGNLANFSQNCRLIYCFIQGEIEILLKLRILLRSNDRSNKMMTM